MNKNYLLILTFILSYAIRPFYDFEYELKLSLFADNDARLDFFLMYYTTAINFVILAYCLHYCREIDKRVSKFILIITVLDFFHLLFIARQGFAFEKIALAILILGIYERKQVIRYIKSKIKQCQI